MAPARKVLMLCGDYMEDYEAAVPLYALAALGVAVDCVAPGKRPGDACRTAVHEFLGFELYTELPGHSRFAVTADFAEAAADPSRYDALVVPGGRFAERLSDDAAAVALVAAFAALRRPVVLTCHSQLLLAAAGAMGGVRCTAFFSVRTVVELAGGRWVDPDPFGLCVADGHVLTAIGWPAHAEIIRELLAGLGARVGGGSGKAVLILCADYVDDYEANVPFRALAGVGCRVEAACPTKRKGESCVTAIHDEASPGAAAVGEERRGHNFAVTADWADVRADDYDCVVVPGGRAPELLVTRAEAVALVREFADKGKLVASIDQGHLLLAAAGLLRGKRCASGVPTRLVSRLAGAAAVEPEGAVADGYLVTAASWPDLAQFVAHLVKLLGVTVSFP